MNLLTAAAAIALCLLSACGISACGTDSPELGCYQMTPGGPVPVPCPDLTPIEDAPDASR